MACPACAPTYLQLRRGESNLCMCKFSSAWRLVRAGQASHKGDSSWAPCRDAAIWEIRHHMETDRISVRGHRTARGQGDQGQRSTCTWAKAFRFKRKTKKSSLTVMQCTEKTNYYTVRDQRPHLKILSKSLREKYERIQFCTENGCRLAKPIATHF